MVVDSLAYLMDGTYPAPLMSREPRTMLEGLRPDMLAALEHERRIECDLLARLEARWPSLVQHLDPLGALREVMETSLQADRHREESLVEQLEARWEPFTAEAFKDAVKYNELLGIGCSPSVMAG